MTHLYTAHGKQILHDGHHFADARDEVCAELIVGALNGCPLASFQRAKEVGQVLHDHVTKMSGAETVLRADDCAWADMVQRVVREVRT